MRTRRVVGAAVRVNLDAVVAVACLVVYLAVVALCRVLG